MELLRADPGRVLRILVDASRPPGDVDRAAAAHGLAIERCDRSRLRAEAGEGMARGVLALARPPRAYSIEGLLALPGASLLVALDGVQDPHNLGAVLRSSEFFGAKGVLFARDRAAPVSPTVVRASAGATERMPLCVVTNLARALRTAKDEGYWILGTVADGGVPIDALTREERLPEALVVVVGGEHSGLRRLTREHCDFLATIPRRGQIGSLNVSTALAVILAAIVSEKTGPRPAF